MKNYYEVLGVSETAAVDEIKKSYKKLAQKHHPDKNGGDSTKFVEIKEAYDTLSDIEKKSLYDNQRKHGNNVFRSGNFSSIHDLFNNPDFLDEIVRQSTSSQYRLKPLYVELTLEECYSGKEIIHNKKKYTLPKGIRHGTKFTVDNQLYQVKIVSHNKFQRSGDNLYTIAVISAIEAILGIDVDLQHLDGKSYSFKIPPGTQNGQNIRLAGNGMPNPELDKTGDLYVQCHIYVPKDLTIDEQNAIINIHNRKTLKL